MVAIFVLVSFFIDLSFIEFTALQKTVVPFADHLLFGVVRDKEAARVEALKLGVTYYAVQEWRPVADFAGKNPELKREAVTRKESG